MQRNAVWDDDVGYNSFGYSLSCWCKSAGGVGFIYAPFLQFFLKLDLKVCRRDTSLYLEYLTTFLVRGELRNQGCCSFLPNAKNAPPPSGKGRGQTSKCMPPPGSLYCIVEGLGGGFHWVTLTIKLTNWCVSGVDKVNFCSIFSTAASWTATTQVIATQDLLGCFKNL